MLALKRILGKDVLSVICKQLHRMLMQQLNAEYRQCVSTSVDNTIIWYFRGIDLWYNYRQDYLYQATIFDKREEIVARLPKNY